jgi:hypothetical protein
MSRRDFAALILINIAATVPCNGSCVASPEQTRIVAGAFCQRRRNATLKDGVLKSCGFGACDYALLLGTLLACRVRKHSFTNCRRHDT